MSHSLLEHSVATIQPTDREVGTRIQRELDNKTKPRGSLGRLEALACQLGAIRGERPPRALDKAVVVMAADHGVAAEGVSAYPQVVTGQMVHNFATGGAAINVLAQQAGARVVVVDLGVAHALPHPKPGAGVRGKVDLRVAPVAAGTASFVRAPAMSREQAIQAIHTGIALSNELADAGTDLIGLGEMGIGNTTSASALTVAITGRTAREVTGLGTGIEEGTLAHKVSVIERAVRLHRPDPQDGLDLLSKLGGFEIAGLCGVVLGASARRVAVLMDGFIASVAALCATRFCPHVADYLIASHASVEPGHQAVLAAIGCEPLLRLELRLGEGTGAALAMPLCDAALAVLHDMSTFDAAGVSERYD